MEIENHKEEVPFAHYEALFGALNPQAVCTRLPDIKWDGAEFTLRLLGREFLVPLPHKNLHLVAADQLELISSIAVGELHRAHFFAGFAEGI